MDNQQGSQRVPACVFFVQNLFFEDSNPHRDTMPPTQEILIMIPSGVAVPYSLRSHESLPFCNWSFVGRRLGIWRSAGNESLADLITGPKQAESGKHLASYTAWQLLPAQRESGNYLYPHRRKLSLKFNAFLTKVHCVSCDVANCPLAMCRSDFML